jgi:hypothetical protein
MPPPEVHAPLHGRDVVGPSRQRDCSSAKAETAAVVFEVGVAGRKKTDR